MQSKPLIGVTLDWLPSGNYSTRPHYALRTAYFECLAQAGAIPVALPPLESLLPEYLHTVDAVLVPGGDYKSPDWWYTDGASKEAENPRAAFDVALLRTLIDKDIPFLGVCAGFQSMVMATGGLMHFRIAEAMPSNIKHCDIRAEDYAHTITPTPGSLLAGIVGGEDIFINSRHKEGVARVGKEALTSATAPDGVVEAIEIPGKKFALGVQWHPEFFPDPATPDGKLWQAFVAAAIAYGKQKP